MKNKYDRVPRVLVGCPTSFHKNYCLKEYLETAQNLNYPNYDILVVDNSSGKGYRKKIESYNVECLSLPYVESVKKRLAESRNLLRERVLKNKYDYFLSLEQDIIPPKDIIQRLLQNQKKIVSAVYTIKMRLWKGEKFDREEDMPVLWGLLNKKQSACVFGDINHEEALRIIKSGGELQRLSKAMLPRNKLIRIMSAGLGCVLIHHSVLKKIEFRLIPGTDNYDDSCFFIDAFNQKIKAYCDTSIDVSHLEKEWDLETVKS